jgi:uncharacterized protein (UPF0371 family)
MGFGGTFGCGSHAQYFTFPVTKAIITIPGNLTYDQAAACIEGASYALDDVNMVNPAPGIRHLLSVQRVQLDHQ